MVILIGRLRSKKKYSVTSGSGDGNSTYPRLLFPARPREIQSLHSPHTHVTWLLSPSPSLLFVSFPFLPPDFTSTPLLFAEATSLLPSSPVYHPHPHLHPRHRHLHAHQMNPDLGSHCTNLARTRFSSQTQPSLSFTHSIMAKPDSRLTSRMSSFSSIAIHLSGCLTVKILSTISLKMGGPKWKTRSLTNRLIYCKSYRVMEMSGS